jgi:alanyl-tRNA synthetase
MDTFRIRQTFLDFYRDRDHRVVDSAPLIPQDPTLLLTIAGMVPFKPYFLGDAVPPAPRMASFQKCVRTNDIENVGRTTRHMSFFEMLGNFSFGDYFKQDAIRWAWQLSVDGFGLEPDRIWVTVWEEDEESVRFWQDETDVPHAQIQRVGVPPGSDRMDASDNFWSTGGAGPCGPCTELNYDRGPDWGEEGGPEVNGERYLEYYNLVFMQHEQDASGNVTGDLPAQNVDTGLGLERMAVLLQGVDDVFGIDTFVPLLSLAGELTGTTYGGTREGTDLSLRVIAEHARAVSFLIADGVLPAKEGRGYVLRRLLRRAVRHAHLLGFDGDLMGPMVDAVIGTMGPGYPDLVRQRELVSRVAVAEQSDFSRRIAKGLDMVAEALDDARSAGEQTLAGDVAFALHDTFGFPVDLTAEIAEDAGFELDRAGFDDLMEQQRQRARAGARKGGDGVDLDTYRQAAATVGTTEFVGYDGLEAEATLGALLVPGGPLEAASEGDEVEVILARTPFYAEGGGQVGDTGVLQTDTGRLEVLDTQEAVEGVTTHRCRVVAGEVTSGQAVHAQVDASRRVATARSHSATHILHATIKEMLGEHAQQAGSLVQPGRLRFDFPHFESVTAEQLAEIEQTINERVVRDPHVHTEVMPLDAARKAGAVANFGDKYGDVVRVVTIGEFSKELCGGTHVPSGATIGTIAIVREESIGSNTRRVEALTGMDAYAHVSRERLVAEEIARLLGTRTDEAIERVTGLMDRLKSAEKELQRVRAASLAQEAVSLAAETERIDGLAVVAQRIDGLTMDQLRQLANELRGQLREQAIIVLGTATDDGKAQLVCTVTGDLVAAGIEARPILHPAAQVVGGGAGGKGDLAQAGGKDASRLDEALGVAAQHARRAVAE